ncbi:MAG TPA: hypothetical protein VFS43_00805 [Polyangiaceae bacterium]|nr:hypothetical protein [Polyangiaceae bacterium]
MYTLTFPAMVGRHVPGLASLAAARKNNLLIVAIVGAEVVELESVERVVHLGEGCARRQLEPIEGHKLGQVDCAGFPVPSMAANLVLNNVIR